MNTNFPTLWREFDNLFRDFGHTTNSRTDAARNWVPAADIRETDKAVEIHLDMPGLRPDDIEVKLDGNVLTVAADRQQAADDTSTGWVRQERSWGRFVRSFSVPTTLDGSRPELTYKHGVLMVTLPKREEVKPKTFKVKVDA